MRTFKDKGFALVSVIIALVIISLMAVFFTNFISTESSSSVDKYKSIKAYYIAQSGLEYVLKQRTFPNYAVSSFNALGGSFSVYTSSVGSILKIISEGEYENYRRKVTSKVIAFGNITGGIKVKQGTFIKRNGAGTQSIAGIGFQPKAVIFYWTRQTTSGFNAGVNSGFGMATGSGNQSAVSVTMVDNSGRSDQGRRYSNTRCIIFLTGGGPPTLNSEASFVSFDVDGFTIKWTTGSVNQYIIHYIAIGGEIETMVSNFNLTTSAGNQSVTGVGFQPDFLLFNWSYGTAYNTNIARSQFGLGFAKNSSEQVALAQAGADNTGNNLDKRWRQRTDSCILSLTLANPPAQDAIVSFVSMDADGFTINISDPPATPHAIFYLAIKGGQHKVGAFNQPTANGAQTISGTGFKGLMALFGSFNLVANTGILSNGGVTIGSATSLNQSSVWYQDRNIDPSDANMYNINNRAISLAFSTALTGQAQLTSFIDDGFTFNWSNCDGTQRQILYWLMGNKPGIKILEKNEVIE